MKPNTFLPEPQAAALARKIRTVWNPLWFTFSASGGVHLSGIAAAQAALPIKIGDEVIGAAGGEEDESCIRADLKLK